MYTMKLVLLTLLALAECHDTLSLQSQGNDTEATQSYAVTTTRHIKNEYIERVLASLPKEGTCTRENIGIRQEWGAMSKERRLDYIRAVKCLMSKPPKDKPEETLATSQYEESAVAHMKRTLFIHWSDFFFPWYRHFLWLYEKELREDCVYKGYLPYWDWSKHVQDPDNYSLFDGSEYSLSGNGKANDTKEKRTVIQVGGPPPVDLGFLPPGTGGGCIEKRPFANLKSYVYGNNSGASAPLNIRRYERCVKRNFATSIIKNTCSYTALKNLILNVKNVSALQDMMQSMGGVHAAGHLYIGGDHTNQFSSPVDPAFYAHHTMVDRIWAIWQSRDPEKRQTEIAGTETWLNDPPSPNATLETEMDLPGVNFVTVMIKDAMWTTEGS